MATFVYDLATINPDTFFSLGAAIQQVNEAAQGPGTYVIDFEEADFGIAQTIYSAGDLPVISVPTGSTLIIDGNSDALNEFGGGSSDTIDGGGTDRGLFVYSGNVTIENLNFTNFVAIGGNGGTGGGGGGAGLGGALFVGAGANVTLSDDNFSGDSAKGGNGGAANGNGGGGGGGLGGNGGNAGSSTAAGGGGGGGIGGPSGDFGGTAAGGQGYKSPNLYFGAFGLISTRNPYGGLGFISQGPHFSESGGGLYGGGGGGGGAIIAGDASIIAGGGGGGGLGGGNGQTAAGGSGGFGGGGGGVGHTATTNREHGGAGGYGGGGGGAPGGYGGAGGFGGGGGEGYSAKASGDGGYGGGQGAAGGGGGGLGAGGDVFVQSGGTLTIEGGLLASGTSSGGSGGGGAGPGSNGGDSGIFIQDKLIIYPQHTVVNAENQTYTVYIATIGDVIADQPGDAGSILVQGGGTLTLTGANSFTGGTEIASGTVLSISADDNLGSDSGVVTIDAGGVLSTTASFTLAHTIVINGSSGGTIDVVSGTLTDTATITGTLIVQGAGTLAFAGDPFSTAGSSLIFDGGAVSFASTGTFSQNILVDGSGTFDAAAGKTMTVSGQITGGIFGVGGGGTVKLTNATNSNTAAAIGYGTLELAAAGDAGAGAISFTQGQTGTLKIDFAPASNTLANTIGNFSPGDTIDFTTLSYNTANPSANTASISGNLLTVSNGTTTYTATLSNPATGVALTVGKDNGNGIDVAINTTKSFTVSSEAQLNAAIEQIDLGGLNGAQNTAYSITLTDSFTLTSALEAINLESGSSVTINGSGGQGGQFVIDGGNAQRGFFVYSGSVAIDNLTIKDAAAIGGNGTGGGGGGAGLGGGLFVASGGAVTLDNVNFQNDSAKGGNGGGVQQFGKGGGGGGLGGNGANGGGGGIGLGADGGSPGIVQGAAGGGRSEPGYSSPGGSGGGGGGAGNAGYVQSGAYGQYGPDRALPYGGGGGGGGIGGGDPQWGNRGQEQYGVVGGNGGFGGGGGGGRGGIEQIDANLGGTGGFGGGGGGYGGGGGFGGGGGAAGGLAHGLVNGYNVYVNAGKGGFGGGGGAYKQGGGGLGAGGDIFVQQGGTLIIEGATLSGGSVAGGGGGSAGSAFDTGIFIQGAGDTIAFDAQPGETLTIADTIGDQSGNGGTGVNAGSGNVLIEGGGTVVLAGNNNYTGTTEVTAGTTLSISSEANLGASNAALSLDDGATLALTGSFTLTQQITVAGQAIIDVASSLPVTIAALSLDDEATVALIGNFTLQQVTALGRAAFDVASGFTTTIANTIAGDGYFVDSITLTGGGTLVLGAENLISADGIIVDGATLRLAASGVAGGGPITLSANQANILDIESADLSEQQTGGGNGGLGDGGNEYFLFESTIRGFSAGDVIDLDQVAYDTDATASIQDSTLVVSNNGVEYDFSMVNASGGMLAVGADANGHLEIGFAQPFAVPDTANVTEGKSVSVPAPGLLGNDVEIRSGDSLSVDGVYGGGTYGSLTLNPDGSYSYTASNTSAINAAPKGSHPTDVFTYFMQDEFEEQSSANLTISIDRPPTVAADTSIAVVGGNAVAGSVLSNDSDPDGGNLAVTGINNAANTSGTIGAALSGSYGALTIQSDGAYVYTPNASINAPTDSHAKDVFTYTDTDTAGVTASTTLTFTLNRAPTVNAGATANFYQGGSTVALAGTLTDSDPDGANLTGATVTIGSAVGGDTLAIAAADLSETGVTVAGNGSSALTFSGNASATIYQSLLRDVTYSFTGDPTLGGTDKTRTISWSVTDADNLASIAATSALDVYTVPVLAGTFSPTPTVTATSGAVSADASLTVTDNNTLGAAPVATVTITSGAQTGDQLFIPSADLSNGKISGTSITVTANDTPTLTLTGTATTTAAQFQNALNEVQFDAQRPNDGARSLTWSFDDDAGGNANNSNSFTTTVDAQFEPQITTLVGQPNVTLATTAVTLTDTAILSEGYNPTGTITFTLYQGGMKVDTETVTVSGDRSYTTPTGFRLPGYGTVADTYSWVATYSGDANNDTEAASPEQTTVSPASPTLTTMASPIVTLSSSVAATLTDTATLAGGYDPTGSITFTLTGPGGTTVNTETISVNGNSSYTTPTGDTLPTTGTQTGTYQWNATYSGDSNNNVASDNNDPNGQVAVSAASPSLTTTASPGETLSSTGAGPLSDSAVLAGGFDPTGSVIFTLSGPDGFWYTQTDTVSGNGTYAASTALPNSRTAAGSYTWSATYSGDNNNSTAPDQGGSAEQTVVSADTPAITTTQRQPSSVVVDNPISDEATVSAGFNLTGTVTFNLYDNPNDTGTPLFTDADEPLVGGVATSGSYTPMATGTDYWVATYNGDSNNNSVTSGVAAEPVSITSAAPSITTTQQPDSVVAGNAISDEATVSGGFNPTGTVTFNLYNDPNGTGTPVFIDADEPLVGGVATTGSYTPTATGTDYWVATYNGDSNNSSVTSATNAEPVSVTPASPTLSTTPNSTAVTLGTTAPTLTDTADLENGYNETGNIIFTLLGPDGFSYTQTDTVNGNGDYTAGTILPTTGTVAGSYQWDASYSGDTNNTTVTDDDNANEQVTVSSASPTLTTTPNSASVTLGTTAPTLTDTADLKNGYNETGNITFTLLGPDGFSYTQTDTVNGNGDYTAGTILPTTGTVAGGYQWNMSYSGDTNNTTVTDDNNVNEQVVISNASPTLTTTPSSATVTLETNTVTLIDMADLEGGHNPTGAITFTLYQGSTLVDTETVSVTNGDGTYSAPTGYTLPATGTQTATYQWDASYGGDANNNTVGDTNDPAEQVVVSNASPTLTTTPSSTTVTLGTNTVTLTDTADLESGYNPTGSITFTLTGPGNTTVDTETVAVNGNKTYTTPTGFTLPGSGTVAGTYTWSARYSGDTNNDTETAASEQTTVSSASPTLTSVASPMVALLTTGGTLKDAATVAGGYDPTGSITFTLTGPGNTTVDTETVTVNGNKSYTTPSGFPLPGSGAVAGTYSWSATYSGDGNNNADTASPEQTTIEAPPTIAGTLANQSTIAEAPVQPFSGVTIGDPDAAATDTLTITLSTTGTKLGTLTGTGLSGSGGTYQLAGTAAAITADLDTLSYTPVNGFADTSVTTAFALSDQSSAFPTATTDNSTSVIDTDLAVPPTPAVNFPHAVPSNVDEWILTDGEWAASAQPGCIPSGYQVAGTGEFTGNGTSDILWQNPATGDTQEWLIDNGAWAGTVDLGVLPSNYQIAGVGDFFGNGIDDVLWTSAGTGPNGDTQVDIWELGSNGQWIASVTPGLGLHPLGYNVVGVGDFNGNGTSDVLWQNPTTGDVDEWQIANGQWTNSVDLGSHPGAGWQISGIGEFFGNGIDDILWTNSSSVQVQTDIWQLGSNGQWIASVSPGTHPAGYNVAAIGNFTGNGTRGVLWYDPTSGDVDEWVLNNNGQWAASVDLGSHPGNFQIAGTGAFVNGNATSDILWHARS